MTDTIISEARKRSTDPAQEHLRSQKDIWNAATKSLIAKLIAFKRAVNGRGDARAGLPPSQITEPFPEEVGNYLNHLADEYVSVIKGAENIIQEQENYASTRRRRQERIHNPAPAEQAAQQPMAAADDGLLSEASWAGSRFWAKHFGLMGASKPILKSIINSADIVNDALEEMEDILATNDPNAVFRAFNLLYRTSNGSVLNLFKRVEQLKDVVDESPILPPAPKEEQSKPAPERKSEPTLPVATTVPAAPSQTAEDPEKIRMNLLKRIAAEQPISEAVFQFLLTEKPELAKVLDASKAFGHKALSGIQNRLAKRMEGKLSVLEQHKLNADIEKAISAYSQILQAISSAYGVIPAFGNFREIVEKFDLMKPADADTNEVRPMTALRKFWLENKLDFLRSSRELDDAKIRAIQHSEKCQNLIDQLLNIVEKPGKKYSDIEPKATEFFKEYGALITEMIAASRIHNGLYKDERASKTRKDVILHSIDNNNMMQLVNLESKVLNPKHTENDNEIGSGGRLMDFSEGF